jgi:hypothetical protein
MPFFRSLLMLLTMLGMSSSWASEHAATAVDQQTNKQADKQQNWQAARSKSQLGVTTTFNKQGVLWRARVDNGQIRLSHSTDSAKTFSDEIIVNAEAETISAEGENRPKIAFGNHDEIYISWTRSLDQPYSGNVRFARSVDSGKHFSAPVTVNDNRDIISHRFEAMGVDVQGDIHLAWLDKRDQSSAKVKGENYAGSAVYYAVSKNAGQTFSTNRKLVDNSCECCRVAMDFDADGSPVIFWRHIYGRNVRDHALLKLDGKSQPVRVSYDHWEIAACPHHGGAISIDTHNNYHLTWFNNGPEGHGLFYAHSTDQGKTFSTAINVGNYDAQAAHPFVLAIKQNVYLVWKEFDGKQSSIQLMRSSDQGNTWQPAKTLSTTDAASDHPLLISDGQTAWLSWNTAKQGLIFMAIGSGDK